MVGFMNQEAFRKTVETGCAVFYSRSRNKLWLKGETSGHKLVVKEISTDCDQDAVLLKVEALGPGVCHEGYESCFFRKLEGAEWKVSEPRAYDPAAVYGS
jgi:phosphoribosyl-AMP cyclohydrolase